ncbi:hypothetical protein SAMN05660649_05010 [Desulfotomaculum arcticum]|uniref:Uncharacterized protein n=1 Tax=Desulfotruncus arcticus DSM 17038 TaxID=1121424 RepID=A0A1I2ZMD1_9FIRM|nr:hypothetical protein SAMN05660649_05010 [Desulfotomaculum arcticum] [Desulfotruncus arcticus DSM 17038]
MGKGAGVKLPGVSQVGRFAPILLSLLNEAREKLDDIIDIIHKTLGKPGKRPRTYRQVARRDYLYIVKNKKPGKKAIRKAVGKQLRYVRRNLGAVDRLLAMAGDGHGLARSIWKRYKPYVHSMNSSSICIPTALTR